MEKGEKVPWGKRKSTYTILAIDGPMAWIKNDRETVLLKPCITFVLNRCLKTSQRKYQEKVMKASEMIDHLQLFIFEHGDLTVVMKAVIHL